jgi:hypothetical protein
MQIEDEYVYINCGFLQIFLQKNSFEKNKKSNMVMGVVTHQNTCNKMGIMTSNAKEQQ